MMINIKNILYNQFLHSNLLAIRVTFNKFIIDMIKLNANVNRKSDLKNIISISYLVECLNILK